MTSLALALNSYLREKRNITKLLSTAYIAWHFRLCRTACKTNVALKAKTQYCGITTISSAMRLFFSKRCEHFAICFRQSCLIWEVCLYRNWSWARRYKDGAKVIPKFVLVSHPFTSKTFKSPWCCKSTSRWADICKENSLTYLQKSYPLGGLPCATGQG